MYTEKKNIPSNTICAILLEEEFKEGKKTPPKIKAGSILKRKYL